MDLKQLKAFATIAEFGSFSRAGAILSVAQPVLSRQIKALEQELGVELLYRNGRGIVLTEAGKLLSAHAASVLESVGRATTEVSAYKSSPRGTTAIGMPPSVGSILTLPLVPCFRAAFPLVTLRVVEGFSGYLLEWLATGRIDVAVLYNAPRMSTLRSEPLLREDIMLLGPASNPANLPSGPIPAGALTELPMILPGRPHGLRLILDAILGNAKVRPRIDLEVDAMTSTLRLVEQGFGYTLLSHAPARDLIEEGRIISWPVIEPHLTRDLILVTSTQNAMTAATRALADMVRWQVRNLVQSGEWLTSVSGLLNGPAHRVG